MKNIRLILIALSLSFGANAKTLYIVPTANQPDTDKQAQAKEVLGFLTTLDAGDTAYLLDGVSLQSIGKFQVPNDPKYRSEKLLVKHNGRGIAAFLKWVKSSAPSGTPMNHSVLIPQVLRHIALNKPEGAPVDVLVLGSPLYADVQNSAFNMGDNVYPSDGHIRNPRTETPFGTDNKNLMSGLRLHICYPKEVLQNQRYKEFVERFWALYMKEQSGELVTLTTDMTTVFARSKENAPPPNYNHKLDNSSKIEMIRLRVNKPVKTIYERPVSTAPMPNASTIAANDVELGLTWSNCATCDLDIYSVPFSGADVLYFDRTQTEQGKLLKDFQSSPSTTNGFETIIFNVPVDLSKLRIVVNFFRGHAPEGVNGTLRISANGETYAHSFHISATDGHSTTGVENALHTGKSQAPQILIIDPLKVVSMK